MSSGRRESCDIGLGLWRKTPPRPNGSWVSPRALFQLFNSLVFKNSVSGWVLLLIYHKNDLFFLLKTMGHKIPNGNFRIYLPIAQISETWRGPRKEKVLPLLHIMIYTQYCEVGLLEGVCWGSLVAIHSSFLLLKWEKPHICLIIKSIRHWKVNNIINLPYFSNMSVFEHYLELEGINFLEDFETNIDQSVLKNFGKTQAFNQLLSRFTWNELLMWGCLCCEFGTFIILIIRISHRCKL